MLHEPLRGRYPLQVTKKVGAPTGLGGHYAGAGLDECNLSNNRSVGEREAAAAGFRAARAGDAAACSCAVQWWLWWWWWWWWGRWWW